MTDLLLKFQGNKQLTDTELQTQNFQGNKVRKFFFSINKFEAIKQQEYILKMLIQTQKLKENKGDLRLSTFPHKSKKKERGRWVGEWVWVRGIEKSAHLKFGRNKMCLQWIPLKKKMVPNYDPSERDWHKFAILLEKLVQYCKPQK